MAAKPYYINKKRKIVELDISNHARKQFHLRWQNLFPNKLLPFSEVDKEISKWFKRSSRVVKFSKKYQQRLRKYGKNTIFFRTNFFTFVIQYSTIITIEISDRDKRHLNKQSKVSENEKTTSEIIANKDKKSPNIPKFRITAGALNKTGQARFIKIGKYDSNCVNGCPEKLSNNLDFLQEMKHRLSVQCPSWTMYVIYASLGKHGELVKVMDVQT